MSATPRQQLEGRVTRRFVRMGSPPVSAARMGRDAVEAYYNEDVEHEHHMLVSYEAIQIMLEVVPTFATGIRAAFETAKLQMERIDAIQRQFGVYARMMYKAKVEQSAQFDASGLPLTEGPYPEDRITGYPYHYVVNGDHDGCACGGHSTSCETWDTNWRHKPTLCGITRTNCGHSPRHTYGQRCPGDETGCVAHGGPDCICHA